MTRRIAIGTFVVLLLALCQTSSVRAADAGPAYGGTWGQSPSTQDWNRFYHYPYVYYPQNYYGSDYYRSSESLYFRYPQEMRVPVYNKQWHNYYPSCRPYHQGHHFVLDVF